MIRRWLKSGVWKVVDDLPLAGDFCEEAGRRVFASWLAGGLAPYRFLFR